MTTSLGPWLRRTDPDRLADVVQAYLQSHHPGCEVDVLLPDYRISGLWSVCAGPPVEADQTAGAARAFASQLMVVEPPSGSTRGRAFVPLSVWSERVGVLVVEFAGQPGPDQLDELGVVAGDLAVALLAADRATDRYRRARRSQRLTMAAEMQWELLPGRALGGPSFQVAGQLEPAYHVSGDHFDWSLNGDTLTLTVLNGAGDGLAATLLTVTAVNAMRNARRSGANLIEQAGLACDAVFSLHGGKHHVATLLLEVHLPTGAVTMIDAGSPRLFRMRGTKVTPVEVDHQLPLGMFADTAYTPQEFGIEAGDRLFIVSDGVHAAIRAGAPAFGERELTSAVRGTRMQSPAEAVGNVMRALHDYHRGTAIADDAVIVCLDWLGPTGEGGRRA